MIGLVQALSDYLQLRHSLGHEVAEAGWLLPDFVRTWMLMIVRP